tara:strand:- start:562 stop:1326 length:765 start_codon:yes stop_codon:yes gene_type:complete
MNLALILLVCMVTTGLMSLVNRFYLFSKTAESSWLVWTIEQGASFFSVFLIVFFVRSFVVEPFRIPSSSLEPTLLVGDFLLVNKFSYGLRLPVLEKKIINISAPLRGDVVVFRWPPNDKFDYIKRVIGMPGDKIDYHNKVLTINGIEAKQSVIEMTGFTDGQGIVQAVERRQEALGDVTHDIFINPAKEVFDFNVTVPKGQYFVMGDNRDHSSDSRYWGFVPDENLRGHAFFKWMSWNSMLNTVRWSRLGTYIY